MQVDKAQFFRILFAIEESALVMECRLTDDLKRELAAFATGEWVSCRNQSCGEAISVLREDRQLYQEAQRKGESVEAVFKYIGYRISDFSCAECMKIPPRSIIDSNAYLRRVMRGVVLQ